MTSRRNTIQKDLVRNTVYEMRRHVTANEVYELYSYSGIFNFELTDEEMQTMPSFDELACGIIWYDLDAVNH